MISTLVTPAQLTAAADGGAYLRFSGGDIESLQVAQRSFNRCEWDDLRLKAAVFEDSHVTRCVFRDCYLRHASFTRVNLTGSRFIRCDLSRVHFEDCRLWYVRFINCALDYDNLLENLPVEVNLRRRLLNGLRRNALAQRDMRIASRLLLLEMAALRTEDRSIFLASTEYFRRNFSFEARLRAFGRWLVHGIESKVWGYGVRLSSLFRAALVVVLLGASVSSLGRAQYVLPDAERRSLSFLESLYNSAAHFTTLDAWEPYGTMAHAIQLTLAICGSLFIGLFAAAAFQRISR